MLLLGQKPVKAAFPDLMDTDTVRLAAKTRQLVEWPQRHK